MAAMLTTEEVANRLNLPVHAVRRLIRQRRIPASDVSKSKRVIYRVSEDDVADFLRPVA